MVFSFWHEFDGILRCEVNDAPADILHLDGKSKRQTFQMKSITFHVCNELINRVEVTRNCSQNILFISTVCYRDGFLRCRGGKKGHHHNGIHHIQHIWMFSLLTEHEADKQSEGERERKGNISEQANRHYETNVVKLMTCNLFCCAELHTTLVILFIRCTESGRENVRGET